MDPGRIKISVAAKILDVKPLTIRRGIYAGRIPYIRTETKRLFIPMSWIQQQTGNKQILDNCSLEDVISIITNFCIKKYGPELGDKKVKEIIKLLDK